MKWLDKWKLRRIRIEDLKDCGYQQQFLPECRYIWKNYVSDKGTSFCLQGELLRELELLRQEAQQRGNINWDEDYDFFCEFIKEEICEQSIYSKEEKNITTMIMDEIRKYGRYAWDYYNGKIPQDQVDYRKLAYIANDLYDMVADMIGKMQAIIDTPIPYKMPKEVHR